MNVMNEKPANFMVRWTTEEENLLLQELKDNIGIEEIAKSHKRTLGGIIGRQKTVAYKMYLDEVTDEDILSITKLSEGQFRESIAKYDARAKRKTNKNIIANDIPNPVIQQSVLEDMKNEIIYLKNTVKELVEMMKAVYVFEDV
jgi:hypothetical protein